MSVGTLICHSEAGSHYEAQAGLELTVLPLQIPKCWVDAVRLEMRMRTSALHG